jgi:hypothetical protein
LTVIHVPSQRLITITIGLRAPDGLLREVTRLKSGKPCAQILHVCPVLTVH